MHQLTESFYSKFGKRAFDFLAALSGLLLLALPMALVAVAIRTWDGPPVLFHQARVGRNGRLFLILKFRTMRTSLGPSTTITVAEDPRITPLGKFLRWWKLDELPQIFNVLKGDMSLVGPRPDVPGYMDKLQGEAAALLKLRPGITGPATLAFRDEERILAGVRDPGTYNDQVIFKEKVRLNLLYMHEVSFGLDLRCIFATLVGKRPNGDQKLRESHQ